MPPIPRLQPYAGPALLSYGFRPFFLLGGLYAGLAVLIWLPFFYGDLSLATAFAPRDWHAHEMIYGYLPAVITGFLLTAIPNWTGRLPLQGTPLLGLLLAWGAGRAAVMLSGVIGWLPAAVIDVSFLLLVGAATAREIIAGRNWGNLKVLLPLSLLMAGNVAFHVEAHVHGVADYSIRIGLSAVLMLIMLIGGRIVPSFTRSWLARENPGRLPAPFGKFDAAVIAFSAAALLVWTVRPYGEVTAAALTLAGALQLLRVVRWAGERTFRDRLVLVLHVAYAFIPAGFVLVALSALGLVLPSAGIHAWTGGAIGLMTLAVMTRATLGHTGRALAASWRTQAIYAAALLAALSRVCAALEPQWSEALLAVAGSAWIAAFAGFALVYGPMLLRARQAS